MEAQSDLSLRIPVRSADELGALSEAINRMQHKFGHIIEQVHTSTDLLVESSQQLDRITHTNIEGAKVQQAETDLVATAITEMEHTAQDVANHAAAAAAETQQADQRSSESQAVVASTSTCIHDLAREVTQAADVIKHLESRSENIGKVVEVITGIAEQTNLLALNAAIEAARAGEQGRGFAVVADEVRTLALRTHESTREIQEMIEGVQEQARHAASVMSQGRELAEKSVMEASSMGTALDRITESIGAISLMNTQIATAAEQQRCVAGEINHNVLTINEIADQSASNSNEIARSGDQLSTLAGDLRQLISQFKT
jgi:methyl-accepting chemotaxis protein